MGIKYENCTSESTGDASLIASKSANTSSTHTDTKAVIHYEDNSHGIRMEQPTSVEVSSSSSSEGVDSASSSKLSSPSQESSDNVYNASIAKDTAENETGESQKEDGFVPPIVTGENDTVNRCRFVKSKSSQHVYETSTAAEYPPRRSDEVYSSSGSRSEDMSPNLSLRMSHSVFRPGEDDEGPVNVTKSEDEKEAGRGRKGNCSMDSRDDNPGRGRDGRKKSFAFGLNKFNLRMFSRSSRSTERLELPLMNNQLHSHPEAHPGAIGLPSSVSKSSSESNIPMCHNSLDNLTDGLPSSRSTDSSCLLPSPHLTENKEGAQIDMPSQDCHKINQTQKRNDQSSTKNGFVDENSLGESSLGKAITSGCRADSSFGESSTSSSGHISSYHYTPSPSSFGQKFKLLTEGDIQVCKVKHGNNIMDKFIQSKLLRRWETHHVSLEDSCISSKTVSVY
jgi:hypothetical protein